MKKLNYTGIYLKLNNDSDADVIDRLKKQKNTQGYLKDLVRTDIELDIFRNGVENGVVKIEEKAEDCDKL